VRTVTFPIAHVDRARIQRRSEGFVKLVTARRPLLGWLGGGRLVGAQIVGPRAGELIHECALAIHTRMFAGRLAQMIHAYPTMSMAVQQAASRLFPSGRALVPSGDDWAGSRRMTTRSPRSAATGESSPSDRVLYIRYC
jgi:hypothetical protein